MFANLCKRKIILIVTVNSFICCTTNATATKCNDEDKQGQMKRNNTTDIQFLSRCYCDDGRDSTTNNNKKTKPTTQKRCISIGITSEKDVKVLPVLKSLQQIFGESKDSYHLVTFKSDSGIANQPVGEHWGIEGAKKRIENAIIKQKIHQNHSNKNELQQDVDIDYWISIENFIAPQLGNSNLADDLYHSSNNSTEQSIFSSVNWFDIAAVVIKDTSNGSIHVSFSKAVPFPKQFAIRARDLTSDSYPYLSSSGYDVTVGQVIKAYYKEQFGLDIDDSDWHLLFCSKSRAQLIEEAVHRACIDMFVAKN